MKIIRIKTDNTIQVLQYPEENDPRIENEKLRKFIGESCEVLEHVRPRRLYEELGASVKPTRFKGDCVGMLIDDNGIANKLPVNLSASWLYGADVHGCPNAPEPEPVYKCVGCKEGIFSGDEYYESYRGPV